MQSRSGLARLIEHNQTRVCLVDYTLCVGTAAQVAALREVADFFARFSAPMPAVVNVTRVQAGKPVLDEAARLGKAVFTPKTSRGAIVGIVGYKKILLRTYGFFSGNVLYPCESVGLALDWVTR